MFCAPEQYRILHGEMPSTAADGNNGMFVIPYTKKNILRIIASDGMGWEHVSISLRKRCPTWAEMSYIKDLFWSHEDRVIQFHPPKSEYVNCHAYTLHLWRKFNTNDFVEYPPSILVGPT